MTCKNHIFDPDSLGLTGRCICGAHINLHTHEITEAPRWLPSDNNDVLKQTDTISLVAGGVEKFRVDTGFTVNETTLSFVVDGKEIYQTTHKEFDLLVDAVSAMIKAAVRR